METFARIYETYFSRVYNFLFRMCNNEDLAEELTQETFFRAFRSFHRFRGDSELFTWLASIAKYTFFSYIRKHKKESDCINFNALIATMTQEDTDPENMICRNVMNDAVRQLIYKMPQKYSDVVTLRIYAELPFSEIADALQISESSAKVLFFRAKKMLLEELKNEHLM